MVVVAVAQHQRIEGAGVDAEELEVVVERLGGEAEVDEDAARLFPARRLHVQREPPFVLRRLRRRVRRERERNALDFDLADLARALEGVVVGVGHHAHRQPVDLRQAADPQRAAPPRLPA